MPRIADLGGVKIRIYFDDTGRHREPHFHAVSANGEVLISIKDLRILDGELPRGDLAKGMDWARGNRELLRSKWNEFNPNQPVEE